MDASTLCWTIDAIRGSVNFGRIMPFAGNTYELVFEGVALEGFCTAYVMDQSGLKCLAKSERDAGGYKIAFNTADLRDEFERNMHEVQTFHVIVRDSKRVVAEGDLSVQWQSLWEDTTTGEVFTMKGEPGIPGTPGRKGDPGERGMSAYEVAVKLGYVGTEEEWLKSIKGMPGSLVRVQKIDENGEETGKWHNVFVKLDQNGRLRIVIGKTEHEPDASNEAYVSTHADMTISGKKTFVEGIIGNLEGTADKAIADHKGRQIAETYLPRTGGTLSGALGFSTNAYVHKKSDTGYLGLSAGSDYSGGAAIVLRGKNSTEGVKGEVNISSFDGTQRSSLLLRPNGTLTWNGNNVMRSINGNFADSQGDIFIECLQLVDSSYNFDTEFASAVIGSSIGANFVFQSGVLPKNNYTSGATVTFDFPFSDTNYIVICQCYGESSIDRVAVTSRATTGFSFETSTSTSVMWFAFGYPKDLEDL